MKVAVRLPEFRYHPDPVATGVFEQQDRACACCGKVRGWVYVVVPYAAEDLHDRLCPWCIADGRAAERFGARFTIVEHADVPDDVDPARVDRLVEELTRRTPGFAGWQRERWLYHCGDAAAYLGPVGWDEIADDPDVIAVLVEQAEQLGFEGELAEAFVGSLDVDGSATAYRFRCRHCGTSLAYADLDDGNDGNDREDDRGR